MIQSIFPSVKNQAKWIFKDTIWINLFTWRWKNPVFKTFSSWHFWACGKCLLCLISGQACRMDSNASSWANKMRTCTKKKKKIILANEKVPVRKFKKWLYQSVTAGCRLKAWVTAHLCFLSWILSELEQCRETAGVASGIFFIDTDHIYPPSGLPGGIYSTCRVRDVYNYCRSHSFLSCLFHISEPEQHAAAT